MVKRTETTHLSCKECGQTLHSLMLVEQHLNAHLSLNLFDCSLCRLGFRSHAEALKHVSKSHVGVASPLVDNVANLAALERAKGEMLLIVSGAEATKEKAKSADVEQAGNLGGEEAQQQEDEVQTEAPEGDTSVTEEEESDTPKKKKIKSTTQISCRECGQLLQALPLLGQHVNKHLALSLFDCSICRLGFRSQVAALKHVNRWHAEVANSPLVENVANLATLERAKKEMLYVVGADGGGSGDGDTSAGSAAAAARAKAIAKWL